MSESTGKFVARGSTRRQGRSGPGLEAQQAAVRQCLNGGNWKIVEKFTEGDSGRALNRPVLERALAGGPRSLSPVRRVVWSTGRRPGQGDLDGWLTPKLHWP
jgi:hypothetical protein